MNQESLELVNNLKFCVFDLETTGGNHKTDKIIEIGLVAVDNLEVTDQKHFLVNPEKRIPDFIQKLTSISQDDVKDAPIIDEIIDEIIDFMGDRILVAHNTSFDVPFFNSVLRRLKKKELENRSLCTNLMTRYLIPNLLNSNLNYMSRIFNIQHNKAHRALDDATAAAKLLTKYLNIFIDKGVKKINHLYYPRNKYELDRLQIKSQEEFEANKLRIERIHSSFLLTVKGENGVILFAYPFGSSCSKEELTEILEILQGLSWVNLTFRLFGSHLESIIQFNNLYNKIDQKQKKNIYRLLKKFYPDFFHIKTEVPKEVAYKQLGDFIVSTHLVPEQFIIFPLKSLHSKSGLIFRYPAHKKKLMQFIQSRSSKSSSAKLRKIHLSNEMKEFIIGFVIYHHQKNSEYLIFDKDVQSQNIEHFTKLLDQYSEKNPSQYNYPKEYI